MQESGTANKGKYWLMAGILLFLGLSAGPAQIYAQFAGVAAPDKARAAKALEEVRNSPLELREFLLRMPKGADLHNHLSGAVYAESFIRAGAEDGLCVELKTLSFVKPVAAPNQSGEPGCEDGKVAVAQAFRNQHLYDALVDAFSMRSFVASAGVSGHDHFFDAFAKFGGTDHRHTGEWIDEVVSRAAAQNEQYMELMFTPRSTHSEELAKALVWSEDFAMLRDQLLAGGLKEDVPVAVADIDQAEAVRQKLEHCGEASELAACKVQVRYVYQVLRGLPVESVFEQTLLAFEVASADARVVGINLVMPEDGYVAMRDYGLHMRMMDFFHKTYPKVHISLHAGEITFGVVRPDGLCCHVRLAVEEGHAERIGHGADVMYENQPEELLKEMAAKHVMVEINLSSNDLILGVSGKDHPFPIYRKYKVPVALSTDDEGVSRIEMTHEYVRAVQTYGLKYADLKEMVRTGLEHSFLPGESLWRAEDVFTVAANACREDLLGATKPSTSCENFLKSSQKAQQQWELERRFAEFEASFETPGKSIRKPN